MTRSRTPGESGQVFLESAFVLGIAAAALAGAAAVFEIAWLRIHCLRATFETGHSRRLGSTPLNPRWLMEVDVKEQEGRFDAHGNCRGLRSDTVDEDAVFHALKNYDPTDRHLD